MATFRKCLAGTSFPLLVMQIHHIQFYLNDAIAFAEHLKQAFGFCRVASHRNPHTHTEILNSGSVWVLLSSACDRHSPVHQFLHNHPPGVVDVAFQVENLSGLMAAAIACGATVIQPLQTTPKFCWSQIQGWGDLVHTLIEVPKSIPNDRMTSLSRMLGEPSIVLHHGESVPLQAVGSTATSQLFMGQPAISQPSQMFTAIDHVVINVPAGELAKAASWYEKVLHLQPDQQFTIQTSRSTLRSLVLRHSTVQMPINEPASTTSQIQEFLEINRGAGVQHVALRTTNILHTVQQLRAAQVALIAVPDAYYQQLRQHSNIEMDWAAIAHAQVLVDWHEDTLPALLLQTFTQPVFSEPTFFFEVIERQGYWQQGRYHQVQGFGERNFQALVLAVEQAQLERLSAQEAAN